MKELRNTHSTTVIPRTGTLVVVQIVDLAEIVAKAREGEDLGALEGLFEVVELRTVVAAHRIPLGF